jgi:hypothetical protein
MLKNSLKKLCSWGKGASVLLAALLIINGRTLSGKYRELYATLEGNYQALCYTAANSLDSIFVV